MWFIESSYFNENKKSPELGSNIRQETGVGSKPVDVSFITSVDKDRATFAPETAVDEVLLVEDFVALWSETEVVKILREVSSLKRQLWLGLGGLLVLS